MIRFLGDLSSWLANSHLIVCSHGTERGKGNADNSGVSIKGY